LQSAADDHHAPAGGRRVLAIPAARSHCRRQESQPLVVSDGVWTDTAPARDIARSQERRHGPSVDHGTGSRVKLPPWRLEIRCERAGLSNWFNPYLR
jgi:hypothetical protein